jgi:TatD DNase family protein
MHAFCIGRDSYKKHHPYTLKTMSKLSRTIKLIDTHCHLEQQAYDEDRENLIALCREQMSAVITDAPDPRIFNVTFDMVREHPGFIFAAAGIHPQYVSEFTDQAIDEAFNVLRENKHSLVGVGETGLDYSYIQGETERAKQRQLFIRFIELGRELSLPIIVHLRKGLDDADVFEDAFEILRRNDAHRVQLHMFGSRRHVEEAIGLGYYISMNAIVLHSKTYQKVVRDTPLENLMLETDAPWLHPTFDKEKRNDPTHVREVAEKIAEIKKVNVEQVIEKTSRNAAEFYRLKLF